ncbi:hypothetical protein B7C51_15055 [Paenibacillus larvae subsp. pulvifaciens]|uniref:RsgI N-terminal anti-sigma domain-containing protein n=1 Tax=Paenibacillus larvae subsp. pulvifaciens TaxID=1477 RepID=A0A1V0UUB6_9BACL|nr:anti-sigma factor domain-containing protein [Paenibacillus larvae]ARF68829.1 hypothetical protein B7C51_15055 [Paenibacillus larvae subsp. pulvifaciens]
MNKGIVMEINGNTLIVMQPNGIFNRIPRGTREVEIGEEVSFTEESLIKKRTFNWKLVSSLTAAVFLFVILATGLIGLVPGPQVVAYVSMDINPSIEVGINKKEIVLEATGLNKDGEKLISMITYKGKTLQEVVREILEVADDSKGALGKSEGDIIISSTLVGDKESLDDDLLAKDLKDSVNRYLETEYKDQMNGFTVTAFSVPNELREAAALKGISAGKYAIYLNAKNQGTDLSLDDFKEQSVYKLAAQYGGIQKWVSQDVALTKTGLRELVDDERTGKLDKRVKEKQEQEKDLTEGGMAKPGMEAGQDGNQTTIPEPQKDDINEEKDKTGQTQKPTPTPSSGEATKLKPRQPNKTPTDSKSKPSEDSLK